MFGGILHPSSIALAHQYLLGAFGSTYYVFNPNTQLCLAQLEMENQSPILYTHQVSQNNYISIDQSGLCSKFQIILHADSEEHSYLHGIGYKISEKVKILKLNKKQKSQEDDKIVSVAVCGDLIFYIGNVSKKLMQFCLKTNSSTIKNYEQCFKKILSFNESYLIVLMENERSVRIFSLTDLQKYCDYENQVKITAAVSQRSNLIIGDEKGKIHKIENCINFGSKKNSIMTKMEWHTTPVSCLQLNGQYLYSSGQESVIVLWHLRDMSRDFLPRIGAPITHFTVQSSTNQIVCALADSSIKIIDISNDKLVKTFKLIIDSQGYAPELGHRFTSKTITFSQGILCTKSLPGRLQFINFNHNGQNSELEIIGRNLISKLDDGELKPHRINNFAFTFDWQHLVVSIESTLRFYRRKFATNYQLLTKIENAHVGTIANCFQISNQMRVSKFISYSQEQCGIKVWGEHMEKRKSIVDVDETYWRCEQQILHCGLKPRFISAHKEKIAVLFDANQIVCYNFTSDFIPQITNTIQLSSLKLKEIHIASSVKLKTEHEKLTLLVATENERIELWVCESKNSIQNQSSISTKKYQSVEIVNGKECIAILMKRKGKGSDIVVFERMTSKFIDCFECEPKPEALFWIDERLGVVGEDMVFYALDGQKFVKYKHEEKGEVGGMEMEESTEIKDSGIMDVFRLSEKWVAKQALRNKKRIENSMQNLHCLPSCTHALEYLTEKLLI